MFNSSVTTILLSDVARKVDLEPRVLRDRYPHLGTTRNGRREITEDEANLILEEHEAIKAEMAGYTVDTKSFAKQLRRSERLVLTQHRQHAKQFGGQYWWTERYVQNVLFEEGDIAGFSVSKKQAAKILGCNQPKAARLLADEGWKIGKCVYYRPASVERARLKLEHDKLWDEHQLAEKYGVPAQALVFLLDGERFAYVNSGMPTARFISDLPDDLCPPRRHYRAGVVGWRYGDATRWLDAILPNVSTFLTEWSYQNRFRRLVGGSQVLPS